MTPEEATERPTPRTDAKEITQTFASLPPCKTGRVPAEFARELERELAEAREEAEEQARLLSMSGEREARLLAELAEAKEQLEIYRNAQAENKRVIAKAMDDPPSPQWIAIDLIVRQLAEAKNQLDEWQRAHDHVCKELATCEEHRDWNAGLWADMKLERDRLVEEVEKWKQNFIPFASVWAAQYGKDRYGENCLDSIHYDMLKEAGARMDDFKRACAPESHNNVNVEARDQ